MAEHEEHEDKGLSVVKKGVSGMSWLDRALGVTEGVLASPVAHGVEEALHHGAPNLMPGLGGFIGPFGFLAGGADRPRHVHELRGIGGRDMGAFGITDQDNDGTILDDGARSAAQGLGTVMDLVGKFEQPLGLGMLTAGIGGAAGTGGLAGIPGILLGAAGGGIAAGGLMTQLEGAFMKGPGANVAEMAGDFAADLFGTRTQMAPGT
jgi:hypothetical protein